MRILIYCAWWKRPELTEQHLQSVFENMPDYAEVQYLAVISPEDVFYKEQLKLVKKYKIQAVLYENKPLGMKLNAGINYAIKYLKFDYMMGIGSDDFILPALWEFYRKPITMNYPCFGFTNVHVTECLTGETMFWNRSEEWIIIGTGRMVSYAALKKVGNLYINTDNSGLDTRSQIRLKDKGIECVKLNNGRKDLIHCYKVNTAINHFKMLQSYARQK